MQFLGLSGCLNCTLFYMTFYPRYKVKYGSMSFNLKMNAINYTCSDNVQESILTGLGSRGDKLTELGQER